MAKSSIRFTWNKSRSVLIKDKGFGKPFYQDLGRIFERHMYKYIPYDSQRKEGKHLADSSRITATETQAAVSYVKPYARAQYYGYGFQRDLSYHPLATSEWDRMCWANEKAQIGTEANAARRRHAR